MTFLVTFADGHSTLVASREAAEQIAAYWPQLHATIRDLDQEARDREEMIGLLMSLDAVVEDGDLAAIEGGFNAFDEKRTALLKRLGRLP